MKCHYEILDVLRDAEDNEIKSAYRKLALKWHPDKNLDNPDFAKEQFQIVQQAYEVLSDKQERAWYDAHRDQILHEANSEFQDKSLDVFQYFTTTCFKGYSDDEAGFYNVYRKVFKQIAKEDIEFMDEKEEFCDIPNFGRAHSDHEVVKSFYDYWMSYSTKKSYSWLDPYDVREGRGDRRLLKIIDKENKKARLKAKKERNEEVRNLVAFVRKRDKRVLAFKKELEAKTLENRKKQEEISKLKRLERQKLHENQEQADWLKFDNVKSELEEIEKHLAQEFGEELSQSENEEVEEDFNNLYCVACNKVFKNPKAFENHEVSKKHRDNVEKLRETMLEEESNVTDELDEYNELEEDDDNLDEAIEENENMSGEDSIGDDESLPEINQTTNKKKETKEKTNFNRSVDDSNKTDNNESRVYDKLLDRSDNDQSDESLDKSFKKTKKKKRKVKNALSENSFNDKELQDFQVGKVSDDDFDFNTNKNQKKKNKKSNNKSKSTADNPVKQNNEELGDNQPENLSEEPIKDKATLKQNARKEKRANKKDSKATSEIDLAHCCVTCKSNFPSKNKLFDHLKKTGHGVYIPDKAKQASKKSSIKN